MSDEAELPESDRVTGYPHPRETAAVHGQDAAIARFLDAWDGERLHHAWLLRGPAGIGKATLAYRIARALIAEPPADGLFGGPQPGERNLDVPRDCPVIGLGSGWDNYGEAMLSNDQGNVSILGNRLPQARDLLNLAQLTNPHDWVTGVELEAAYIRDRVVQLPAASAGN